MSTQRKILAFVLAASLSAVCGGLASSTTKDAATEDAATEDAAIQTASLFAPLTAP